MPPPRPRSCTKSMPESKAAATVIVPCVAHDRHLGLRLPVRAGARSCRTGPRAARRRRRTTRGRGARTARPAARSRRPCASNSAAASSSSAREPRSLQPSTSQRTMRCLEPLVAEARAQRLVDAQRRSGPACPCACRPRARRRRRPGRARRRRGSTWRRRRARRDRGGRRWCRPGPRARTSSGVTISGQAPCSALVARTKRGSPAKSRVQSWSWWSTHAASRPPSARDEGAWSRRRRAHARRPRTRCRAPPTRPARLAASGGSRGRGVDEVWVAPPPATWWGTS